MDFEDSIRETVQRVVREALQGELHRLMIPENDRPINDGYVSVAAAAKLTDFDEEVIRRRIATGDLVAFKPKGSREYRVPLEKLRLWVEGSESSDDLDAASIANRILSRRVLL